MRSFKFDAWFAISGGTFAFVCIRIIIIIIANGLMKVMLSR